MAEVSSLSLRGWAGSLVLHAGALFALFFLPVPPSRPVTDPFTWDVQIVQPAPEPSVAAVAPTEPTVFQPASSPSAAMRRVHTTQVVTSQVRTIPSEQKREIKQVQVVSAPSPQSFEVEQRSIRQVPAAVHSSQPIRSTDAPQAMRTAVIHHATPPTEREAAVHPQAVPHELMEVQGTQMTERPEEARVADASVPMSFEQRVMVERGAVESHTREAESKILTRPAEVTTVTARAVGASQAHYGWLKDELREQIERVKYYPQQALDRKWEGRVIVCAVIWADGRLSDLSVVESSGYDALDREALGLLQRISPLQLKYALGVPQITLRIPINYGIK